MAEEPPTMTRMLAIIILGGAVALAAAPVHAEKKGEVIELTQVACQFVESEKGVDHGFETRSKADCEAINARTGGERLRKAKVLRLEPGTYTFRVTNVDVPYELGFWLREKGYNPNNPLHHVTKTSISGGGLLTGQTQDYTVELAPGEYVYSCPLNPTPDYRLVVEG